MITTCDRHPDRGQRIWGPLLLLAALTLISPGFAQEGNSTENSNPNPAGIVLRRDHKEGFVGGSEILVQVTISANTEARLFALGLYESPPDGWTFEGLYVDAGPQPDILPPMGASGVLEFGWVTPTVPVSFRYALRVPASEGGARFLTGQVEYRLESDPKRNSAPVLTQIVGIPDEAPVLTLQGAPSLTWPANQPYQDPGVTAQDKEDGDISAKVERAGNVDVSEVGTYTLTFGVVDSAGNRADAVSREVQVIVVTEEPNEPSTPTGPPALGMPSAGGGDGNGSASGSSRGGNRGDNIALNMPRIALGGNRPSTQLPAGQQGNSGGSSDTSESTTDTLVTPEEALARRASLLALRADGKVAAEAAATPEESGTFLPLTPVKIKMIALALALFLIPAIVSAARWHGVFNPPRRRPARRRK